MICFVLLVSIEQVTSGGCYQVDMLCFIGINGIQDQTKPSHQNGNNHVKQVPYMGITVCHSSYWYQFRHHIIDK
jgi:hypothetical protein